MIDAHVVHDGTHTFIPIQRDQNGDPELDCICTCALTCMYQVIDMVITNKRSTVILHGITKREWDGYYKRDAVYIISGKCM